MRRQNFEVTESHPRNIQKQRRSRFGSVFVFDYVCEGGSRLLGFRVGFERNFDILSAGKIKIPGSRRNFAAAKFRGDRIPPPQLGFIINQNRQKAVLVYNLLLL